MKNLIFLILFTVIIIIGSCKKRTDSVPDESQNFCKINESEIINYNSDDDEPFNTLYRYNSSGEIEDWAFEKDYTITYQYLINIINVTHLYRGTDPYTIVYELNEKGQVIAEKSGDDTLHYTYNDQGYVIKMENLDEDNRTAFLMSYQDGNLLQVNIVDYGENGEIEDDENDSEIIFTYSNELNQEHVNYNIYSLAYPYMVNSQLSKFFGKRSKNLLTSIRFDDTLTNFEYEKNFAGKIVKVLFKRNNGLIMEITSKLNCN